MTQLHSALQLQTKGVDLPRLIVWEFEHDEDDDCVIASVGDIVEGERDQLIQYIEQGCLGVPAFLRTDRTNEGEIYLFPTRAVDEAGPIIQPTTGLSAGDVYDMLLDLEANPAPKWGDIMPHVSAQRVSDMLMSGALNADNVSVTDYDVNETEYLGVIRAKSATSIFVYQREALRIIKSWQFDIAGGCFIRRS